MADRGFVVVTDLLTTEEAADVLGVSPRTMEGWRVKDQGPKFLRIGGRLVRYRREDLAAWLKKEAKRG